jgi:death-on-curing protein
MEIKWITREIVLAAHRRSLQDHSGAEGIRDEGRLESALGRPPHMATYGEPTLFELAASYGFGLVKNHPFVDGNKRMAYLTTYVFLGMNGHELDADEAEAAAITLDLAAGAVSEEDFAIWLQANCKPAI